LPNGSGNWKNGGGLEQNDAKTARILMFTDVRSGIVKGEVQTLLPSSGIGLTGELPVNQRQRKKEQDARGV